MALNHRYQADLIHDAAPSETRIAEAQRRRVRELLGELILLVMDVEVNRTKREEMDNE